MENRAGRKGIEEKNEKNDTALGTEGEKDTKSKGLEKRLQENRKMKAGNLGQNRI